MTKAAMTMILKRKKHMVATNSQAIDLFTRISLLVSYEMQRSYSTIKNEGKTKMLGHGRANSVMDKSTGKNIIETRMIGNAYIEMVLQMSQLHRDGDAEVGIINEIIMAICYRDGEKQNKSL